MTWRFFELDLVNRSGTLTQNTSDLGAEAARSTPMERTGAGGIGPTDTLLAQAGLYHLKCLPVTGGGPYGGLGKGPGGDGFRLSFGLVKEIVGRGPSLPSRPG